MLIRFLRIGTFAVTAIAVTAFLVVYVAAAITNDKTIPVITVPDSVPDISVEASDADLLEGITAFDKKDGDITNRILVESISRFTMPGYCKVTYAVCDSDNHVATASRHIHYKDYTPPKFKLNRSPVFSIYNEIDTNGLVGAKDCLDGDISRNVIIYSPDYKDGEEGEFTIQATAVNSKGDTAEISLPMLVEKLSKTAPEVKLDTYLIYVKKNSKTPDWNKHIKETLDYTGVETDLDITVKTDLNTKRPGLYHVNFYGTDAAGNTGHTIMLVAVE